MNLSELINEIISEWAYRVNDGMPDAKNPAHLKELSIVLNEMGLSHIKNTLIENLLTEKSPTPQEVDEADSKQFTNPVLNKSIKYKNDKGEDKEGIVGNLLRLPKDNPGRVAAEKLLPADDAEKDAVMKDLGSEKDGKSTGGEEPKKDGEEAPKGGGEEEKAKAAQAMFDPKVDPAMASRLDKEKEANAKLVQKDKEASDKEAELNKKDEPTDEFKPINVQDVAKEMPQADTDTFSGGSDIPDGVEPEQLKKFNTDIQNVAQQVADAKAKGEPAPNINLCDVTVPGTNLYCDDNLGIPRDEMPQFKGNASPGSRAAGMEADASGEVDTEPVFREMLKQKGINTLQTEVPADKLKATQKDLVGAKVVGMMGALEKDPNHPKITAPIYVSRDGYVIDGHHRWAAIVAYNAANPDKQIQMKTTVLDQDIKDAIPMANKFAEDMGITAKKADANKETPSTPTSVPKLTDKIKQKIENWTKEERAFFEKNEGAPGSEMRRSLGQTLKDKAAGAWKAIKKGAKHEVEEFKAAGSGVKNFFSGKELSEHEVKAVKAVGFKIVTTALFGAATGGIAHGAAAFGKHVAMEFIPHVIGETILKGAGRAALFADMEGEAEMDANMEKFAEIIAKGLEEMEITPEMMEQMVDSYNKKKEENPQKEMTEENLQLADELMLEMIYGFIDEVGEQFKAKSKDSGKVVVFKSKDAMDAAVKSGSHEPIDTKKSKTDEPVKGASMFGADYQKDRGATVAKGGPGSGRRPEAEPAKPTEPERPRGTARAKTDAEFLWMKDNAEKITNLLKRRYPDMDDKEFNKKANDVIKATWDSIKDKPQAQQRLPRIVDPEAPQRNTNRNIVMKGGPGSGRDSADIAKAKIDLKTKYPDWDDTKINATARALMAHTRIGKQPFKKTVMKNVFKKRLDNAIPKEVRGFSADDFSTVPGEISKASKEFSGFYHRGGGYYSQTPDGPITHILKRLANESISEAGKPQQSKVKKTDLVPISDLDLTASQKGAVTKVANAAKKEISELPSPKDEATKKKYRESTKKSVVDSLKLTKSEVAKKEAAEKAELESEVKAWEKRKADAKKKGEPFKEPKPKKKNKGVGLGSPDSRAGESAVVLGSIRMKEIMDKGKSYEEARAMVAAELKKFVGPDSYLTDSWIKSALNTLDLMEREIGFNNVEEFGWDNPEGRALVGSQNHGTSSDMFVKTKDGKRIGVSLKKDLKVFIFNGGYTEMSENLKERGFNLSENSAPEHYVQRRTEEFAQGVKDITKNKKAACAAWEGMKKKPADTFDPLDKRVAHILKRTGKKKLKDVSCDDFVNNILTDTGGDSMKLLSQFYQNPEIAKISPAYGKLRGLDREMTDSIAKDFGTPENQKIVKDLVRDETHISDILFGENPNLDELKVVYGTDPAIEMKKEKLVQLFGIDKEYAKFEKETDPKKKAAIKKKIEDAINDKISVSTKGGVMSIAITVKDSNGKESAIPLFEAKIRTRGIGAAPTFEMAQNTFGGLAFKYGTSDYTKWDEKDRKVVVGSSLNDLEEEFGNELGRLDKKTQAEIGLRLAELDKISPNHPKVKAFRLKYLQVMKK